MKSLLNAACLFAFTAALCACTLGQTPPPAGTQPAVLANLTPRLPTLTPFQPLPVEPPPAAETLPAQTESNQARPPDAPTIPPTHAPTPSALSLYLAPELPLALADTLNLPAWLSLAAQPQGASLTLVPGGAPALSHWVYALVAPFPTIPDGVSAADLQNAWHGRDSGPFAGRPLLMDEATYHAWAAVWGPAEQGVVNLVTSERLVERAWERRPAWAILPFESLESRWKVLTVDGLSPIQADFEFAAYPLSLPISIQGDGALPDVIWRDYGPGSAQPLLPPVNRDPSQLTTLAMTGVTALVRATAHTMEQRGVTYPARDIGEILRQADITHISNEVPFARNCPYPNPVQPDLRFCSDARYIELLEHIGTDIVELTGDHFADWGTDAMHFTLDLYEARGWPVYGGGRNLREGRAPITLQHNGNHLAFIGCNAKGGGFAQAGETNPGAVPCDFAYMHDQIARLSDEGYNVIVTFQHFEYYTYLAQPNQVRDAQGMAEAGAVIVSGSQAHQPQGMEFYQDAFIHHGLGNLFFDQLDVSLATRQGFIDRHIFYGNRHISIELIPILFVDYARARPMTPDEAASVYNSVFSASGW
jgi:hypothetical protein